MDNFNRGEQDRLDKLPEAIKLVKDKFNGLEKAPVQTFEPVQVDQNNILDGGGSQGKSNAKVRVLTGPTPGYVPTPEREQIPVVEPQNNPFLALRSDNEPSNFVNNNSAFTYVAGTVLIVVLIALFVIVTLGILKLTI